MLLFLEVLRDGRGGADPAQRQVTDARTSRRPLADPPGFLLERRVAEPFRLSPGLLFAVLLDDVGELVGEHPSPLLALGCERAAGELDVVPRREGLGAAALSSAALVNANVRERPVEETFHLDARRRWERRPDEARDRSVAGGSVEQVERALEPLLVCLVMP